jgi:hypothetical protein
MIEHNCKLGCTSHLSTWVISTWLIWDIPTCCSCMFSLMSNKCLAILILPSVPALLSLSRSSKPLLIKENISSQKFFTSLALPLLSDMFCSQTFNKILPLVCYAMDNFELLTVSIFVVAITTSWKATRATSASLSFKEMFPNIYSIVWKWF